MQAHLSLSFTNDRAASVVLVRGSTELAIGDAAGSREQVTSETGGLGDAVHGLSCAVLDNPDAAGSVTYKVQFRCRTTPDTAYVNRSNDDTDTASFSRAVSTLFLQEIMG